MDNVTATIAEAVAQRIDYQQLADLIADRLRNTQAAATDPDAPLEVAAIRAELGRRGRPMAPATFHRNYIQSGLLQIIEGPNRSKIYVRSGDWERVKKQTK